MVEHLQQRQDFKEEAAVLLDHPRHRDWDGDNVAVVRGEDLSRRRVAVLPIVRVGEFI